MAVQLLGSSSEYIGRTGGAIITAYPYTMAAFARADAVAAFQEVLGMGALGTGHTSIGFSNTGAPRAFVVSDAGGAGVATAGAAATDGVWAHIAGVFTNATSRAAYLNGGDVGTNATNLAIPTITHQVIGRRQITAPDNYLTGAVAEAAIWDVALDAAEIAALGKGICPLLVRPQSLIAYWPLDRNSFNKSGGTVTLDRWKSGYDLNEVNTPTLADHPRIYYPAGVLSVKPGVAVPVATTNYLHGKYRRSRVPDYLTGI
jgi:hypothetical protein